MCIGWLSSLDFISLPHRCDQCVSTRYDAFSFSYFACPIGVVLEAKISYCSSIEETHTHTIKWTRRHTHTHTQPSSIYQGRKVHYACACAGIISNEQRTRRKATSETTIQQSLWMKENEEVNNNVNRRHIHTQRTHTQTQQQQKHSPYTRGTN